MSNIEIKTNELKSVAREALNGLKISTVSAGRTMVIKNIVKEYQSTSLLEEGFLDQAIETVKKDPLCFLEGSEVKDGVIYSLNSDEEVRQGLEAMTNYFTKGNEVELANVGYFTNLLVDSLLELEVVI